MKKAVYKYRDKESDLLLSLKEGQQYLINLLGQFSLFCRDHKIEFFLLWGTLLGAKREGKMIPWDDDIDIGVTDDNYLKLVGCLNDLKNYGIDFLHFSCTKKMYSNEIRLYIPGFYKLQESNVGKYITPLCIDVFVANKINTQIDVDLKKQLEKQIKSTIQKLIKKEGIWKSKNLFKYCIRKIEHLILSIHSTKHLHLKLKELCEVLYNHNGDYQYCFPETLHNQNSWLKTYQKNCFENLEKATFENLDICIPSKSDEILELNYGDWKTPKDRSNGHVYNEVLIYRKP